MELHFGKLPEQLSLERLQEELNPFMEDLDITLWDCQKPRNKNYAFVTFLEKTDANRFLDAHGKQPREQQLDDSGNDEKQPRKQQLDDSGNNEKQPVRSLDLARLNFLNTDIFVGKSNRGVNKSAIKRLKRKKATNDHQPHSEPRERSSTLECKSTHISCGHIMFRTENSLAFIEQTRFQRLLSVKFGRRSLIITLCSDSWMNISHREVEGWIMNDSNNTLTLILRRPPRCYVKVNSLRRGSNYERHSSISVWPDHSEYVASCRSYQLKLLEENYATILRFLLPIETVSVVESSLDIVTTPRPFYEDYPTSNQVFEQEMRILERPDSPLPFPFRFLVQALVSNAKLHPATASEFLTILKKVIVQAQSSGEPSPVTVESLKVLSDIPALDPGMQAVKVDAQELLDRATLSEIELRGKFSNRDPIYGASLTNNHVFVFKAIVTPTSIIFEGPEPENMNGVLRMYLRYSDYFLRVTFCDEDGEKIRFNPKVSNEAVYNRYRGVLKEGIKIAGRSFMFLAFPHSSLRSNSAWFVAPFKDDDQVLQDNTTIVNTFGDFSQVRTPAKCAARIGQLFSETPYSVSLAECGIRVDYINDVKSSDNSRVFSDGVGTISWNAVKELRARLPQRAKNATCFQIRLGGIKGMLSLDSSLVGKVILIRKESMEKFPSKMMDELGICDMASKPLPLYLNRQTIKIMEDMGSKHKWFLDQQRKAVRGLQKANRVPPVTSSFLKSQRIGTTMDFPWLIKRLNNQGINFQSDRFLKSIVEHAILRELRALKYRTRIRVTQGVTLFGIMDEFSFLEEGEIYVAYDKNHYIFSGRGCIPIRDGTVLITRSPALHPGDVQIVQHRTPPARHPLLALRNCVVFSQKGNRDLPSQLSGGDLDGDLFSILWDAGAIPQRDFSPADYPRIKPAELDRDVTQDDIADFFVNFMKTDNLGLIAIRHQIMADIQSAGTQDPTCKVLAGLHSEAVDYSKSGQCVSMRKIPKRPKTRPDL